LLEYKFILTTKLPLFKLLLESYYSIALFNNIVNPALMTKSRFVSLANSGS